MAACGGETRATGDGTGGGETGMTTAGATDGDTGGETTTGADDTGGTTTGGIPDCAIQPPVGATCNPYTQCESGCGGSDICTITALGEIRRVACAPAGPAALGASCDAEAGPTCAEGACVNGSCRTFCIASADCGNAACAPISGVPGKPTLCGENKSDCDLFDPINSCPDGLNCYLVNQQLTDCVELQAAGQEGNECSGDCPSCCNPGLICVSVGDGQHQCGTTCAQDEASPNACMTLCQGKTMRQVTPEIGACLPQEGGGDGGGTTGGMMDIPCNLLAQDCPNPETQGCYPAQSGHICLIRGTGQINTSCSASNDCVPGAVCFAKQCRTICDPEDPLNGKCEKGASAQCPPQFGYAGYCDE